MPIRDELGSTIPTSEDLVMKVAQMGILYAGKNKLIKKLTTDKDKDKGTITKFIKENTEIFDVNGNHLEITAPAGDGLNEVFIQLQNRKGVKMVDNVIDALREKLGATVDNYITKVEVLHENALEAMFNNGLITKSDIDKLVIEKNTEVLIVNVNKKTAK